MNLRSTKLGFVHFILPVILGNLVQWSSICLPSFLFFKSLACISFLHMYPTTFFAQIFILLLCRWLSQSHQWSTIILAAVIIFLLTCPLPWSCILQLQDFFFFFWPLHSTGWDLLEDAGCRKPGSLFSILRSTVATRKILLGYCIQTQSLCWVSHYTFFLLYNFSVQIAEVLSAPTWTSIPADKCIHVHWTLSDSVLFHQL